MDNKIVIEVFGLWNESAGGGGCCGGCSCSGGCAPAPTMGESYKNLVELVDKSEWKDKVVLRFIDVMDDNLDEYEAAKQALQAGLALPLTSIDGLIRFYGELAANEVVGTLKEER